MYSPADLPSRIRAAPAKKRKWSEAYGISSSMVIWIGLPVSRHSTLLISSARASIASAILSNAAARSCGVVFRHDSKAVAAAPYARSTSSADDIGACPYTSPVVGSITSYVAPSAAVTASPLMMLEKVSDMGQVKRPQAGASSGH